MLSDRWGRKPIIACGLTVFVAGSAIAAMSHGMTGIIIGRAVQGAGAVGAATLALAADLTRPEQRTKAIGMIGGGIGLAFGIAVVAGPAVNTFVGLSGIFWLTAVLGALGLVVLRWAVPSPHHKSRHRSTEAVPAQLGRVLKDSALQRMYVSIFMLHLILVAPFLVLPGLLGYVAGLTGRSEWLFYLPVLAVGLVLMVPAVIHAERRGRLKSVSQGTILLLALTPVWLRLGSGHLITLAAILAVFFGAFTLMEALLPSLISRLAHPASKGSALGIYSTSQFLGIFVGGALGGVLLQHAGRDGVYALVLGAGLVWMAFFAGLKPPRMLSSRMVSVTVRDAAAAQSMSAALEGVEGVEEAVVMADEGVAVLRVRSGQLDEAGLEGVLAGTAGEAAV